MQGLRVSPPGEAGCRGLDGAWTGELAFLCRYTQGRMELKVGSRGGGTERSGVMSFHATSFWEERQEIRKHKV